MDANTLAAAIVAMLAASPLTPILAVTEREAAIAIQVSKINQMRETRREMERRWATTDRAWCFGIKHLGVDPEDESHWPDTRACRGEIPQCPFKKAKPGPCPDFSDLLGAKK